MIRPALALLPSLLILLASLGPPDRDQVEARWEDSPPGERVASAIEEVRPPPEVAVEATPIAAMVVEPPAPASVVERAVVYTPPILPVAIPLSVDLSALVAAYFPTQAAYATRVMMCESGGRATAVSPGGDRGLMQINPVHARYDPALGTSLIGSLGYTWDDMFTPGPNLAVAAALVKRAGGWRDWTCAR